MASLPISMYLILLHLFFFSFKSSTADQNLSFSFKNFCKNSSFDSVLDLYGDAKVVNGGSSLQLTGPLVSSVGRAIYRKPIKLYAGIPKKTVSFSTFFLVSDSRNRAGLAFVVFPDGDEPKLLSVKYNFFKEMGWGTVLLDKEGRSPEMEVAGEESFVWLGR